MRALVGRELQEVKKGMHEKAKEGGWPSCAPVGSQLSRLQAQAYEDKLTGRMTESFWRERTDAWLDEDRELDRTRDRCAERDDGGTRRSSA